MSDENKKDPTMHEVTEGLKEGEMIVIEGSHRLQDGYKVEAVL